MIGAFVKCWEKEGEASVFGAGNVCRLNCFGGFAMRVA